MQVLVVDDDAHVRRVVRRGLEREGWQVVEAEDGTDALEQAAAHTIDVAVLDLHMPGMSGLDLLAELRRDDPALPVIMLTGAATEADRVHGLVSGADDYVAKPFSSRELAARVTAVGRRRTATASAPKTPSPSWSPENSQDAMVVLVNGVVTFANPSALALLRADGPSEVLGRVMFDFVAPSSVEAVRSRYAKTREGHWPRPEMITVRRLDGQDVLVEIATMPVMWQGEPATQLTIWDLGDDTAKLRELALGIRTDVPDAVVVVDMQGRIQSMNPAAEALYGWTEAELLGRDSYEAIPWVADPAEVADAERTVLAEGHWHGERASRRRDRSVVRVRTSATLIKDGAGQPIGIAAVNREIPAVPDATASGSGHDEALAADIRRGVDAGEFVVHYQPIVRLHDRSVVGAEALVRWQHPEHGLLPPAAFIDVAELSGSIVELGAFVYGEACAQWTRWHAAGHDFYVSVNLSGRQLADPELPKMIAARNVPPGALWLEVTETSLVADLDQAARTLHSITDLGGRISIDDFGTGWASLTYLREFPVHALKIDRAFVSELVTTQVSSAIVTSVIGLGRELGLKVIAEGIETSDQLDRLVDMGCEFGQGYLFGRPVPAADFGPESDG